MHFVTENELRTNFQKKAFKEFCLKDHVRLTPGAKQFLLDKKIQILSETELQEKTNATKQALTSLDGYKEVLSAELLEAALFAMKQQLSISQKIIDLEKMLMHSLGNEPMDNETPLNEVEEFRVETVHIFSEQGVLLIKLKKIYGIIRLIQSEYPQYGPLLVKASRSILELKKQLLGETDEKTINERL